MKTKSKIVLLLLMLVLSLSVFSACDEPCEHKGGTATCQNKAVCTKCDKAYGELASHNFKDGFCTICNVADPDYVQPCVHSSGTATCQNKAVCDTCGESYGELANHIGDMATCTLQSVCHTCGENYGELADHIYNNYSVCTVCAHEGEDYIQPCDTHSGGEATCIALAKCEVCKREYGEFDEHNGGEATCQLKAVCEVCHAEYGGVDSDNHSGGEATCIDKAECEVCGESYGEIDSDNHNGGIATCIEQATCDNCSQHYGNLSNHSFVDNKCSVCGFIQETPLSSFTYMAYPNGVMITGFNGQEKNISIPKTIEGITVTQIGYGAFEDCNNLISITIPEGVVRIGIYAFRNCTNLTNINIPDSLLSIGYDAFWGCGITSIVIPNGVTDIDSNAFVLGRLQKVYYAGTADDWQNISIATSNDVLVNATRYYYSETLPLIEGNYWHYDNNGNVVEW